MTRDAVELLLTSELLQGVSEAQLRTIAPPPEWVAIAAGETLIRQGEPGTSFYFLVHGRLRVFVEDARGMRQVGEVMPGEGVGEMSLLTDDLTSATVRVMHDSSLIRFSRASYLQLMETCPEAALQVTRTVIKRLRQGNAGPHPHASFSAIAVVPLDPAIDAAGFCGALVDQLASLEPAVSIAPDDLEPELAAHLRRTERLRPEHDHAVTARLLALQRARKGIVVYQAAAEPNEWTRIAIRQADLVLLLATVGTEPGLRPVETRFLNRLDRALAPRTDLVMLHPGSWRRASGTGRWLAARHITEHHHLRQGHKADLARLARVLTGNAICLVLSGGGARGLAQIGVLRALQEAGIPIDRVGGTSMGSIIGAMHALGYDLEQITAINRAVWIKGRPLSDYTFPALSIIRGRRLHNMIRDTFVGHDIEDLPIPFFCIASNLTNADQIVYERGPLWRAVRASASLPGAGPPLFVDGNVVVDGGVLNNLPIDVMHDRFDGYVIGVDVGSERAMTVPHDFDQTPSGWRILWSRLNPFGRAPAVPGIFEVLYRTATLNACRWANTTRRLADLVITPPVGHIGTLEFKPFDRIIEIGYRNALEVLSQSHDPRLASYSQRARLPLPEPPMAPPPRRRLASFLPRTLPAPAVIAAALLVVLSLSAFAYLNGFLVQASSGSTTSHPVALDAVREKADAGTAKRTGRPEPRKDVLSVTHSVGDQRRRFGR